MTVVRRSLQTRPHALYRFYDAGGDLLYVGITATLPTRLERHGDDKPWWTEVDQVKVQHVDSRSDALLAEEEAIKTEEPRYNVKHNARPAPSFTLNIPCQKCGGSIGDDGAFYLPFREQERFRAERKRQDEFEERRWAESGGGWVVYSGADLELVAKRARWQIHCTPCMAPCFDHPDEGCDGCGGSYWFYGHRADTWPKIVDWTVHLMGKRWLSDTNWRNVLNYLKQHNGPADA